VASTVFQDVTRAIQVGFDKGGAHLVAEVGGIQPEE
jgi:hypothetical protein